MKEIADGLGRPAVWIAGVQKRFGLPGLEIYPEGYESFLRKIVHLRVLGVSEETLREFWGVERKLIEVLHLDPQSSPTWMVDACAVAADPDRRLLLSNIDLGFALPAKDLQIASLLKSRKFVILEGPPGTGKSRMAANILAESFKNRGVLTQFHPSTTYEDFVAGLSPDIANEALRFTSRAGQLMEAAKLAKSGESLLFIDEINRADLGRVLGEAIYLFEPGKDGESRCVRLPHRIDGEETFSLPTNLYVLATMNTADRSVARMDLAIRRRFAFVTLMPDRTAVEKLSTPKGLTLFDQLCSVFLEFAQDDALVLMPGHSYFIADNDETLNSRLRHELIPLIDEYLREGYLGPASASLYAVRLQLADAAGLSS